MQDNIKIEERDIFNYVFYPDAVAQEKADFIKDNKEYKSIIELYNDIKNNLKKGITSEQKKIITSKISSYKYQRIITLYPVKDEIKKKPSEVPILAAASQEKEPRVKTQTFIDGEEGFVIRLVRVEEKAKIYVFPIKNEWKRKICLTLQPSNQKYHITDINTPLDLTNLETVEAISLDIE